jgi:hypothetical protein
MHGATIKIVFCICALVLEVYVIYPFYETSLRMAIRVAET